MARRCGTRNNPCPYPRASWWKDWLNSGGGGSPAPSPESMWGTEGDNSLLIHFNPSNTYLNYIGTQPSLTECPTDYSTTDGDIVTFSTLTGKLAANKFNSIVRSSILGSDGTRNSFVDFGSPNTTKFYEFRNSKQFQKGFYKLDPHFSIFFWIKKATNGTQQVLFSSTNNLSTVSGIEIRITNTNLLRFQIPYSSSGNYIVNKSTTATITVADGWVPVCISVNGNGVGAGTIYILKGASLTTETFDVAAASSTADTTNELRVASGQTVSSCFDGLLSNYVFRSKEATIDDFTFWAGYNPTRAKTRVTIPYSEFDSSSSVFSDTLVTPAVNAGTIQSWGNKLSYGDFNPMRYMVQTTAAQKPVYTATNVLINNKPSLGFVGITSPYPGTNSSLISNNAALGHPNVPVYTDFFVVLQTRVTDGSHVDSGNSSGYDAIGGSGHSTPSDRNIFIGHIGATNISPQTPLPNGGEGVNVIARTVNIPERISYGYNHNNVQTSAILIAEVLSGMDQLGFTWKPAIENWWLNGFFAYRYRVYGEMSAGEIATKMTELKTFFGVS